MDGWVGGGGVWVRVTLGPSSPVICTSHEL